MTTIKDITKAYEPALILDKLLSQKTRNVIKLLAFAIICICIIILLFKGLVPFVVAILSLSLAIWLGFFMLNAFYASYYFEGYEETLHDHIGADIRHSASFESARLLYQGKKDIVLALCKTEEGQELLLRCGLSAQDIKELYTSRTQILSSEEVISDGYISLEDIARSIVEKDKEFTQFLFKHSIQKEEFIATALWIDTLTTLRRKNMRSWGRERLGRIPGIGKEWSYGQAYRLEKYGKYINEYPLYGANITTEIEVEPEVKKIEEILSRTQEANVLLISESTESALEVISRTAFHIEKGTIFPELEHKKIFVFDGRSLVTALGDKQAIEQELIQIFNDAVKAGNLIIVLSDLEGFISSAQTFDVDVLAILDPFLAHSNVQMIATLIPSEFYSKLEQNTHLIERFEIIKLTSEDTHALIHSLEGIVPAYEIKYGVLFTYPALSAIADGAMRYFSQGILSDKIHDLMEELIPFVRSKNLSLITAKDVSRLISQKTGVPTGEIQKQEKELLLNLEEELHKRVIGQEEAIKSISNALRRARSGIRSSSRPMGSFLFLGPTGVGKTETTKALAQVFFGSSENMTRFDMSEYRGPDALDKLIGSFTTGQAGTLTTKLREKPYGVILLDEFEKTTHEVKDLFLQIFDEGAFSDMGGKKVYARDALFIATSNAGSDMIWEYFNQGEDVTKHTDDLINTIIQTGVFKPELLNRFDGVITFHPLSPDNLRSIARLMIMKLRDRLYEQSIDLEITQELITYVAEAGYDVKFGARPMNRVIQDKIEQYISRGMLDGSIIKGSRVRIDVELLKRI